MGVVTIYRMYHVYPATNSDDCPGLGPLCAPCLSAEVVSAIISSFGQKWTTLQQARLTEICNQALQENAQTWKIWSGVARSYVSSHTRMGTCLVPMNVMNTTKEPAADPAAVTTETAPKIAAKRVAAELAVAKQMQKTKTKKATAVKEVTEDAPPQATEAVQISGLISDGGPSPPTEFGPACRAQTGPPDSQPSVAYNSPDRRQWLWDSPCVQERDAYVAHTRPATQRRNVPLLNPQAKKNASRFHALVLVGVAATFGAVKPHMTSVTRKLAETEHADVCPPPWLPVLLAARPSHRESPAPRLDEEDLPATATAPPMLLPSPPPPPPCTGHTFTSKDALKTAVTKFDSDADAAIATYGPIGDWCVSGVTDMSRLFYNMRNFNADISSWDTSSVTDMYGMFGVSSSPRAIGPQSAVARPPLHAHSCVRSCARSAANRPTPASSSPQFAPVPCMPCAHRLTLCLRLSIGSPRRPSTSR